MEIIQVTKTFLPPLAEYVARLERIWASGWLTNNGECLRELELALAAHLGIGQISIINNGTVALQIALKALEASGEIITTPFSYVATTSSVVWEGCTPVFVDIDPATLNIDAGRIEAAITDRTSAILATHVFGNPCQVLAIEGIAKRHRLKVIYDGAHAFGVRLDGRSVFTYGDLTILSFHATKLFHTVEGGGIVCASDEVRKRVSYMRNFGHNGSEAFFGIGINGKNSELHAAMGLCLLPHLPHIMEGRKRVVQAYDAALFAKGTQLRQPVLHAGATANFSYYPIIFPAEASLLRAKAALELQRIMPRRYFYPCLSTLPYVGESHVPIAEDISSRILCLPLHPDLGDDVIALVCRTLLGAL